MEGKGQQEGYVGSFNIRLKEKKKSEFGGK